MAFSVYSKNIDSIHRQLLEHGIELGLLEGEGNPIPWQDDQEEKLALYPARWAYIQALLDIDITPLLNEVDAEIKQIAHAPAAKQWLAPNYFFANDYKGSNT